MTKLINWLKAKIVKPGIREEEIKWLGRVYRVWPGTIRKEVDYDDAWYQCLAKEARCIVDVGANIGYTALLALSSDADKRLLLIDPNPEALGIAALNLFKNGYSNNVTFDCTFVSDKNDSTKKFYTVGAGAAGSEYPEHADTARSLDSWFIVTTKTLDSILAGSDMKPDFVKIDVEGSEFDVLQGLQEYVRVHAPRIFVEMHSNQELSMVDNATSVINWCKDHDYSAWYLKEHRQLLDAAEIKHRGKCHLLLLPADDTYPQQLKSIQQGDSLMPIVQG